MSESTTVDVSETVIGGPPTAGPSDAALVDGRDGSGPDDLPNPPATNAD
jgi:hypothetical protein